MTTLLSLFFFLAFLFCQNRNVKNWLKERSCEQTDIILLLLTFISGLFGAEKYSIVLEDKLYGLPWALTFETSTYLFFVGFIAYSLKYLNNPEWRSNKEKVKLVLTSLFLLFALIAHSPLVWALAIIVISASLNIEITQKRCIQVFPLVIVLIELYSASMGYGLTQQVVNKYDTIYSSGIVTSTLPFLFLLSILSLLSTAKKTEWTAQSLMPGSMLLYGLVSAHFNTDLFFKNIGLFVLIMWSFVTISIVFSSSALFKLSQIVIAWAVLLFLALVNYQLNTEAYMALAITFLAFTILKPNPAQANETSVLVLVERSILLLILISHFTIYPLSLAVASNIEFIAIPYIDSVLMIFTFWILILRLNLNHLYNIKSENFLDFSDSKFIALSLIKIISSLVLAYFIFKEIDVKSELLLLGVLPPAVFVILNIMGHREKVRLKADRAFIVTPMNFAMFGSHIYKGFIQSISNIASIFEMLIFLIIKAFMAVADYLCFVSISLTQKVSKYKIPSLFMIWIIMISIVASWSL